MCGTVSGYQDCGGSFSLPSFFALPTTNIDLRQMLQGVQIPKTRNAKNNGRNSDGDRTRINGADQAPREGTVKKFPTPLYVILR
jgi:hypothetical protein